MSWFFAYLPWQKAEKYLYIEGDEGEGEGGWGTAAHYHGWSSGLNSSYENAAFIGLKVVVVINGHCQRCIYCPCQNPGKPRCRSSHSSSVLYSFCILAVHSVWSRRTLENKSVNVWHGPHVKLQCRCACVAQSKWTTIEAPGYEAEFIWALWFLYPAVNKPVAGVATGRWDPAWNGRSVFFFFHISGHVLWSRLESLLIAYSVSLT